MKAFTPVSTKQPKFTESSTPQDFAGELFYGTELNLQHLPC